MEQQFLACHSNLNLYNQVLILIKPISSQQNDLTIVYRISQIAKAAIAIHKNKMNTFRTARPTTPISQTYKKKRVATL